MEIDRAIEIMGGQRALAKEVGVTYQAVQKWRAGRVPAERCVEIERVTGGKVTRYDLRPDLFDVPATAPAAANGVA